MSLPILGYFDIRGWAEPIRYLLRYADVKFIDKKYPFGEGTTMKDVDTIRKYWTLEKFNLGLDFPNVPYYIDGDTKLTQSLAILRHLGREYGLYADDEESLIKQDIAEQQMRDFSTNQWFKLILNPDYEKAKVEFIEKTLPPILKSFSDFLSDNLWFSGKKLTYVDFFIFEIFDWIRLFNRESLQQYPKLTEFMDRIEKLPSIAKYRNSDDFKSWPLAGPVVKFGYAPIVN